MILSFADKDSASLFAGRCPRRWLSLKSIAERKLVQLDAAATLSFLRVPPGNRLEALKGNLSGQWSIRVNDQWRICFRWDKGNAYDVCLVDYH